MENSVFLVGWPKKGFSIGEPINHMMVAGAEICRENPQKFNDDAKDIFTIIPSLLRERGFRILDTKPRYGGADGIFLRDKFICMDERTVVLSRFASETRRPETEDIRRIIKPEYVHELPSSDAFLEGGDYLRTPFNVDFLGVGPRSDFQALEDLSRMFPSKKILPLELTASHYDGTEKSLKAAKFFHADTAAFFAPHGDLAIYRPAFTEASWKRAEEIVRKNGRQVYQLSLDEARGFGANIKALTPTLLLTPMLWARPTPKNARIGMSLKRWLLERGYTPWHMEFRPFMLAGGGPNCLIQEVPFHMLTPTARRELSKQTAPWAKTSGAHLALAA